MSDERELTGDEALAAEHALGVLGAAERAAAEARMAVDTAFAAEVEGWRARLAPLVDEIAPVTAPSGLWERIARSLPANDNALAGRLRFWRRTAIGSMGLAAASLAAVVVLGNQPPVILPAKTAPVLNASLVSQTTAAQPLFVAAYDPQRRTLIVTSLMPAQADPLRVHELWLIPADGRPRSLGIVTPGVSKALPLPAPLETLVQEGVQLAVSIEPPGGSPDKTKPSGPIAAMGPLAKI